ncbi:MAG: methyltransferase domain-containing protein [Anaeromyxobacteraceae bacterium]
MNALGRTYAKLAFGPASFVYEALTGGEGWRRDCREMAALVPGPRVLDLGIGPGTSALEMARADPARLHVGLDLSAAMVRTAAARASAAGVPLPLLRADALRLPVRTGAFDGATGHSLLYLLPDPAAALAEVVRVLRPGGGLAFLEPAAGEASARDALRDGPRHLLAMVMWRGMSGLHRRFTPDALVALGRAAGLADVKATPALSGYGVVLTGRRAA